MNAPEYAVEFGHEESRDGDNTRGSYHVLLPDGRRQLVQYTADLDGYKPVISYEDTGAGAGGGPAASYGEPSAAGRQSGGYSAPGASGGYSSAGTSQQGGYSASGPY